jgi:hypothetical protein
LEEPEDPLDGTHRIVTAQYSTELPPGGAPILTLFGMDALGSQNSPWTEPPHIEWDGEEAREARETDLDGKRYLNAAKQPFKPAPTIELGRAVLIYERNESSHDVRKQTRYTSSINADEFLGEKPGTVKLHAPRARLMWRGGISYWRVTYRFVFNTPEGPVMANRLLQAGTHSVIPPAAAIAAGVLDGMRTELRTWQTKLLNCGLMQLQKKWPAGPNANLPVPIWRNGSAVTEPVLLNEDGTEMKPDPTTGLWPDANFIEFRDHLALPFTPLLVAGLGFPS